jgi:carboxypeptidase family protein
MTAVVRRVLAALSGLMLLLFAVPAPASAGAPATGLVTGIVRDYDGRPAAGITASLKRYSDDVVPPVRTDRAGRFAFPAVAPGAYWVQLTTPGGTMTLNSDAFELAAGDVERVEQQFAPHGAVAGRILTDRGAPAGGAQVGLSWVRELYRVQTDADGRFFLDYLPPHPNYQVRLQRQPTGSVEQWLPEPVAVEVGQVLRIDERLRPSGFIAGTFTGPDGPIKGSVAAGGDASGATAEIAADGSYRLNLWPGDYRLFFDTQFEDRDQWATATRTEAEAEVIHVVADQVVRHDEHPMPNGTIGGRLLAPSGGQPTGPATVDLVDRWGIETIAITTTDSAGFWSFAAFPTDYLVRFRHANQWQSAGPFEVFPERTTTAPDEKLAETGDVELTVTVNGEPVQQYCLELSDPALWWWGGQGLYECTEDGTVRWDGVNPITFDAYVQMPIFIRRPAVITAVVGRLTTATVALTK